MSLAVFVDYDGTITNLDTFDVLVRACAGAAEWQNLEDLLRAGTLTLREVLQRQAAFVHLTLDEADAFLARETVVDPAFAHFVHACQSRDVPVTVLSSGIKPLIHRALSRVGLGELPIVANDVRTSPNGWTIDFIDDSDNGHDKAATVRASAAAGNDTVYCGDGHSDFAAALVANHRFAKSGRALETYLQTAGVAFTPFATFKTIERELFAVSP